MRRSYVFVKNERHCPQLLEIDPMGLQGCLLFSPRNKAVTALAIIAREPLRTRLGGVAASSPGPSSPPSPRGADRRRARQIRQFYKFDRVSFRMGPFSSNWPGSASRPLSSRGPPCPARRRQCKSWSMTRNGTPPRPGGDSAVLSRRLLIGVSLHRPYGL